MDGIVPVSYYMITCSCLWAGGNTHTLAADGADRQEICDRFLRLGWMGLGCGETGLGYVRNGRNSDLDFRFYSWLGNIVVDGTGITGIHYWGALTSRLAPGVYSVNNWLPR